MEKSIDQDVCKAVRGLGLSPERTRRIVDGVHRDLSNNGPEWVLERLKGLTAYYTGESPFPGWMRRGRRKDGLLRPKGWMGSAIANSKETTVLAVLSTIRGAIVLSEPSLKQLDKWKSSVMTPPTPRHPTGRKVNITFRLNQRTVARLESDLKKRLKQLEPFGPDDVHGIRIPVGVGDLSIKRPNKGIDAPSLYRAWKLSIMYAPANAWSFQDQSGVRIPGMSIAQARPILNRLRKEAPDSKTHKRPGKRKGRTLPKIEKYPIGHISFLQEPFGKLRTVANPNRFVQWQLTPLGETLSRWVNSQPGVYVLNQEEGIQWIQQKLREGVHLTSADLSSASDTLDYKQVLDLLYDHRDVAPELCKHLEYFSWCSRQPWYVTSPKARDYLGSHVISWTQGQPLGLRPSFPILTLCNLAAARSAVHLVDGSVKRALSEPPFVIVGDDIVIETKYASAYSEVITGMGGLANLDKSMASSKQAEFCSRLITAKDVLRLKAKFLLENGPQNILTYQGRGITPRVPSWQVRSAKRVGAYSLMESHAIPPYFPDQPASFRKKVLFHAAMSLEKGAKTNIEEKSLLSMWYAYLESGEHPLPSSNKGKIHQPKPKRGQWTTSLKGATPEDKWKVFQRWNPGVAFEDAYQKVFGSPPTGFLPKDLMVFFCEIEDNPRCMERLPHCRWIINDPPDTQVFKEVRHASARMQRVESQKMVYDHHKDARVVKTDPSKALGDLTKQVKRYEDNHVSDEHVDAIFDDVGGGIERSIVTDGRDVEVSYYPPNGKLPTTMVLENFLDIPVGDTAQQEDEPEFEL